MTEISRLKIHSYQLAYAGKLSGHIGKVSSNLIIGDIVGAFLVILPTIAVYIGGALLINILVFNRKELDF